MLFRLTWLISSYLNDSLQDTDACSPHHVPIHEKCRRRLPPPQQSPIDYASAELQTVKCAVEFSPNEPTHAHTLRIDYSRYAALCVSGVVSFSSWGFRLQQRELKCSAPPMYAHLLITGTAPACIIAKLLSPTTVVLLRFSTRLL